MQLPSPLRAPSVLALAAVLAAAWWPPSTAVADQAPLPPTVVVHDDSSTDGPAPGVANREETDDGRTLTVHIELDPGQGDEVLSARLVVSDRSDATLYGSAFRTVSRTSPIGERTFEVPLAGFPDGPLTVRAILRDDADRRAVGTARTVLDLTRPVVSWTTQERASFVRIRVPFVATFTSGDLRGAVSDTATPVHVAYMVARNVDTAKVVSRHVSLEHEADPKRGRWSTHIADLGPGEWRISVHALDEAGNVSVPASRTIVVYGAF